MAAQVPKHRHRRMRNEGLDIVQKGMPPSFCIRLFYGAMIMLIVDDETFSFLEWTGRALAELLFNQK